MSQPHYILWDHDGVLVDTEPWYFDATRRALGELSVSVTLEEYLEHMARGQTLWYKARDGGASEQVIDEQRRRRNLYYREYLINEDIEIEGVADVLKALSREYAMAIVTTALKPDFELIHRDRNIVSYMDFVLTRDDYKDCKPAPDPYLAALERFGASADEAVVIEDSQRGLTAALAAGIRCLIVDNAFTRTNDFKGATGFVGSLNELPYKLKELV